MGNSEQIEFQKGQRILEINTSHPIIQDLSVSFGNANVDLNL